jgi:hypothetical protein
MMGSTGVAGGTYAKLPGIDSSRLALGIGS